MLRKHNNNPHKSIGLVLHTNCFICCKLSLVIIRANNEKLSVNNKFLKVYELYPTACRSKEFQQVYMHSCSYIFVCTPKFNTVILTWEVIDPWWDRLSIKIICRCKISCCNKALNISKRLLRPKTYNFLSWIWKFFIYKGILSKRKIGLKFDSIQSSTDWFFLEKIRKPENAVMILKLITYSSRLSARLAWCLTYHLVRSTWIAPLHSNLLRRNQRLRHDVVEVFASRR